jgi:hypothetical protein
MRRRDIVAAAAGAVVATVLAGGVAWAAIPGDGGVYSACMLRNVGTVRLIDKSLPPGNLMSRCKPALEVEISWSEQGPQGLPGVQGSPGQNGSDGEDGESPTVQQLAAGDANCPAGGAAITDASGSTAHVCDGQAGADGQPFAGTFTSPNGEYSISVTDAGITIARGSTNSIVLSGADLDIRSEDIDMESGLSTVLKAGTTATVDAQSKFTLKSSGGGDIHANGVLDLEGSVININ